MTASPECARVRLALGVYVLGSIDPAERVQVDRHLAECEPCREELASIAGIPGLLGRLQESEVAALADPPEADHRLLDRILTAAAAAQRRTRRRVLAAVAAVVLLLAGIGTGAFLLASDRADPPPAAVQLSTKAGPITVRVGLTPKRWGTSVDLQLSGVKGGHSCQLIAVARDGRTQTAASYTSTDSGRMTVTGATGLPLEQIRAFRIVDTDGRTLITLPR